MNIDYMLDDDKCCTLRNAFIDKNGDDPYDAWDAGWRAACEAWHKKAQAKAGPERSRYWAIKDSLVYWRWTGTQGEWVESDGTIEPSDYQLHWFDVRASPEYIPCTTEAEARRVAGFPAAEAARGT